MYRNLSSIYDTVHPEICTIFGLFCGLFWVVPICFTHILLVVSLVMGYTITITATKWSRAKPNCMGFTVNAADHWVDIIVCDKCTHIEDITWTRHICIIYERELQWIMCRHMQRDKCLYHLRASNQGEILDVAGFGYGNASSGNKACQNTPNANGYELHEAIMCVM